MVNIAHSGIFSTEGKQVLSLVRPAPAPAANVKRRERMSDSPTELQVPTVKYGAIDRLAFVPEGENHFAVIPVADVNRLSMDERKVFSGQGRHSDHTCSFFFIGCFL
jgi:hypothetical protein